MADALQSLLEERFHLKTHRDTRELPVYTLTIAKGGPRLTAVQPPSSAGGPTFASTGYLKGTARPMSSLVNYLSPQLRRPVVDQTGLQGFFDIELKFAPDPLIGAVPGQPAAADPVAPTLFTAVQEQFV